MEGSTLVGCTRPPADSRKSGGYLAGKYGLRLLEKMKDVLQAVPRSLALKRRLKLISEISQLPLDSTEELVNELDNLAPLYCKERLVPIQKEVLCPPVTQCLNGCRYLIGTDKGQPVTLSWHRKPTEALLYTAEGRTTNLGILTLRCSACKGRFGYQSWTSNGEFQFYDAPRDYVKVSKCVYVPRSFARQISNAIYFDHSTYEGVAATYQNSYTGFEGFTRKIVSTLYIRYEIECDFTERGLRGFRFKSGQGLFQYVTQVIPQIFSTVYSHRCSPQCILKGCGTLFVADGLWKIGFRLCKAVVTNTVGNVPLIRFPNVCTNGCAGNSGVLRRPQMDGQEWNPECCCTRKWFHPSDCQQVAAAAADAINALLSGELQDGVETFECVEFNPDKECFKDKGASDGRSYLYSRGYTFMVRSTGHVDAFGPLFRAESLGQVFLFVIAWLYQTVQKVPREKWSTIFLAYDNMCQLNRLKASREPLPLPAPCDMMWSEISKIVDGLHIRNHKDQRCKQVYNPDLYYQKHPGITKRNTMSAEQTFAWLASFRKQINAMPRDRQIFFIHRLVVRRNEYLSTCIANGVEPVGGSVRSLNDRGNRV